MSAGRRIGNYCADRLSEKKNESLLKSLFACPKGQWILVRDLCIKVGIPGPPIRGAGVDLVVVWLDDPSGLDDYLSIVFFSPVELWSTAALYNRSRLGDATEARS
jgi:hypothetical protein